MRRISLAVTVALLASGAHAMNYAVNGIGAASCGTWVNASHNIRQMGMSWVLGYLTAMNAHEASLQHACCTNLVNTTDVDGVEVWVTNYCQANPLQDISDAAINLYIELKNRQQ
ncbi:hypothetical protein [Mesorhizobium sp. M4B.F.Ca.ET.017.02.2.1]|uniref:hypothetical protein n=1 Tax=Mesorhizobium sp. M4B.F.Ca.ET.017.02.2.1 TaxID=2496649 RepID=UPI000FCC2363|nr:hypothetical protein [Mesorhizobium sp. M4B.F.Ca.ET.017.02.2.1]RVD31409.1 hypothetical protein EN738_01775 [Mesorhizobium sp. M4B.F.Ca.ET.017.02.2.1]